MPQQGRNEVNRDIREATADEISAAKEKQRLSEEEGHAKSLWDKAAERTVVDPNRPLYARELLASGKMRDWWSPSWRDVKELVDGEVTAHYSAWDLDWTFAELPCDLKPKSWTTSCEV